MRLGFLLFIFCVFNVKLQGQYFSINNHEIPPELEQFNFTGLYRDSNRFLYITTKKGLIRYDGNHFEVIKRNDQGDPEASAVFYDGHVLWVGFGDGAIFQYYRQQLHPWNIDEGWPKARITGIYKDPVGVIWISTYGEGLYMYDQKNLYNINEDDGLGSNDLYEMTPLFNGSMLVATDDGLYDCSLKSEKKSVIPYLKNQTELANIFTRLDGDRATGNLMVTTYENQIYTIQTKTGSVFQPKIPFKPGNGTAIHKDKIYAIHEKSNKQLWIFPATEDPPVGYTLKGLESEISVIDMIVDNDGILWMLCKNHGLLSIQLAFTLYDVPYKNIQSLANHPDGLLIGNDTGLYLMDKKGTLSNLLPQKNIVSLYYDKINRSIWAGTYGHGLIKITYPEKKMLILDEKNGLANNTVFSITRQGDNLWISTLAGIQKLNTNGEVLETLDSANGLPTEYNYTIFGDDANTLWIGSDGKGLIKYSNNKIQNFAKDSTIISVTQDNTNQIWFASMDKGIGKLISSGIQWLTTDSGLTSNQISGIRTDRFGRMLSIHEFGIDIIQPSSGEIIFQGNNAGFAKWKQNMNNFTKDDSESIYIGIPGHIIQFYPEINYEASPKLIENNIQCGIEPLINGIKKVLDHTDHNLRVDFSGIYFPDTENLHFRYKLDPLEKEWRYTRDLKLVYTELPPGEYLFSVQLGLANYNYKSTELSYPFQIKSAFYQTTWFYILCSLLLVGLMYIIIQYRNKQRRRFQEVENEKIKMQLETLKSQINPHFLFNSFNTLIGTIEHNKENAVEYVEKLSDFYRNMLEYRDKNFIKLSEEKNNHEDYIYLLKQRYKENLVIHVDIPNDKTFYIIPLTLQLLTENAIKHNVISSTTPLEIFIRVIQNRLEVKNIMQPRVNIEKSTHFGLQSLSKRYKNLTGEDILITKENNIFTVSIPLKIHDTDINY